MSTTTPTTPPADAMKPFPVCGRRTVLRAVGLVALSGGATAILAACSADTSTSTPSSAPTSDAASPPATSPSAAESPSASAGETEQSDAEPEGTKVAISDVPVGGGVVIEKKYVVTQPAEGEFKVFSAICTHQQNPVGEVTDKQIICPFHQSHFSITDGSVISGPAQTALPAIAFTTSGDNIIITG